MQEITSNRKTKWPQSVWFSLIISLAIALLVSGRVTGSQTQLETAPFVVKPYIQLGNNPQFSKTDSQEILWISKDHQANWQVEMKLENGNWKKAATNLVGHEIANLNNSPDYLYKCQLIDLPLNSSCAYKVIRNGHAEFEAQLQSRKSKDRPYRFAVFGDMGSGSEGQRLVAWQCYKAKPDFIVMPGDIVYSAGLYSEYLNKYFPVYNADRASPETGAPIIRNTLTVGVLGNHDIALTKVGQPTDLTKFPNALAYFFLWSQPLNGPLTTSGAPYTPPLTGGETNVDYFKKAAGRAYPVMANFSFDYGNSHWVVLDANYYVNWSDGKLRRWLEQDLDRAKDSTWRFVTFHQPGFSVDVVHGNEQHMRLLSDIFERDKVDIVFCGHAHDYQRSYPLFFKPELRNGAPFMNDNGTVPGEFTLDKNFDGKKNTDPHGVIYIVTGAGGAPLYKVSGSELESPKDFIDKANAQVHSLTVCDVKDNVLDVQQVGANGQLLDQFVIAKKEKIKG